MFEEEEEEENENNGGYRSRREEPLYTEKIFADRKIFFVDLKSNDRGKFLKITEDVRGRRDTIMGGQAPWPGRPIGIRSESFVVLPNVEL